MKTKNGKSPRPLPPGNHVLDEQMDDFPDARQSWLTRTLGLDQDTRRSQRCAMAAEVFLQTRLFPLVQERQPIDEQTLVELLVDFRRSRGEREMEFEMSQVIARLLNRFQHHLVDQADSSLPALSRSLERELGLFTLLAPLDFQSIDRAVRERLHSG